MKKAIDLNNFLDMFELLCLGLKCICRTPVDFVASACVMISLKKDSTGKTFHILNPKALTYHQIGEAIQSLGYSLALLDYQSWRKELLRVASDGGTNNPLVALLPYFGETFSMHSPQYDTKNTDTILQGEDVKCPLPDKELIRTYLDALARRHLIQ